VFQRASTDEYDARRAVKNSNERRPREVSGHFQEFEDEYLETLYEFHEEEGSRRVRTGELAARLGVSAAAASEMVQRLAQRGFLDYVAYQGVRLTEEGLSHGRRMKRRHRLAEVLLDVLPYDGDAHATACRLEHAIDDDLEVALTLWLQDPQVDPSGRDIPVAEGDVARRLAERGRPRFSTLLGLKEGEEGEVVAMLGAEVHSLGVIHLGASCQQGPDGLVMNGEPLSMVSSLAESVIVAIHS
jgi:DtxR family Mn-dependent transcriptional regulator